MAKRNKVRGPAIHPSCAMAHPSERTPDPITAVMICALAVHTVPVFSINITDVSMPQIIIMIKMLLRQGSQHTPSD